MLEAKVSAITGILPSRLEDEPGGMKDVLDWLAARSILEGVVRGGF